MKDKTLTIENLNAGISKWKFDVDYHNDLYSRLYAERKFSFSEDHWDFLIFKLADWGATRPKPKQEIHDKCLAITNELKGCLNSILKSHNFLEPDILTTNWNEIEPLFKYAFSIKETNYNSPVFASKLCHFLLPKVFFISDNLFIKRFDYPQFWQESKKAWSNCSNKDELINILKNKIGSNIIDNYPFATKITDLCYMGKYYL